MIRVKVEDENTKVNAGVYKHYKGGLYKVSGVAMPLIDVDKVEQLKSAKARYHEDTHDITILMVNGVVYIEAEESHVIYTSLDGERKGTTWAREMYNFTDMHQLEDGTEVKRFQSVENNEVV